MKRKAPMKRGGKGKRKATPLRRYDDLPPRNEARRTREWVRTYGSKERVEWVKAQPCVVPYCHHFPSENAHVGPKGKGVGRKADADQIAPLCHYHHYLLHTKGPLYFAGYTGVSPAMLLQAAEATEVGWKAYCGEMAP